MAALEIPKSPDSLSAGSGAGNASIASFEYEPIAAGVGFLGKLGRLRLQYADGREGLPRTLICKLPTLDEKSRQLVYEREVSFYHEIGSRAGIRVPVLHYGAADRSNGDFIMLMEDLAPARVGDQLEGCVRPVRRRQAHAGPEAYGRGTGFQCDSHARWHSRTASDARAWRLPRRKPGGPSKWTH